jgi:hypothetical protein
MVFNKVDHRTIDHGARRLHQVMGEGAAVTLVGYGELAIRPTDPRDELVAGPRRLQRWLVADHLADQGRNLGKPLPAPSSTTITAAAPLILAML